VSDTMLIHKGAEANLYLEQWHNRIVIRKQRVVKKYRLPELDYRLRYERTRHEAKLLHLAKRAGVPTPLVYFVDIPNTSLIMQFLNGNKLRDYLMRAKNSKEIEQIFNKVGIFTAKLHKENIIHGDLTTSNMILYSDTIFFIDFGLGFISLDIEDKAVDIRMLKTVLNSTHYEIFDITYNSFINGYRSILGSDADAILTRLEEVERRGRYISER